MRLVDHFVENEKLRRAWAADLNTADPAELAANSHEKVWWRCQRGHEWQSPCYSAVRGDGGCPYCAGKRPIPGETDLATTHPHLVQRWSGRNAMPPASVTAGSHRKVWWICGEGHEWEAMVVSVAIGACGCPYCMGYRAIPGETDLVTLAPEVAEQWDHEKNGGLDPGTVSPASHDRVWWRCGLGHSWQAAVFSRTKEKGAGCPYCTGRSVLPGFNDLATLKPGLAEEWYEPLNGGLKPSDVTLGSNKKVWWRCSEHHVWQAVIYGRTRRNGTGCPVCAGVAKSRRIPYMVDRPKLQVINNPTNNPAGSEMTRRRFGS